MTRRTVNTIVVIGLVAFSVALVLWGYAPYMPHQAPPPDVQTCSKDCDDVDGWGLALIILYLGFIGFIGLIVLLIVVTVEQARARGRRS